jgi:D-glycero-D-manno-heptose 1,7-bisphosphate phosphatase
MQAVVLVGGRGTRLGELTESTPKPLLPVGGRPFIDWLLHNLDRYALDSILLLAGYRSSDFERHIAGLRLNARIDLLVEDQPLGTGGALVAARDRLDRDFLLLNGDTLFDFNYLDLASRVPAECLGAVALRNVPDASRYGTVAVRGGRIGEFVEKGRSGPGLVNGGVYYFRQALLDGAAVPSSLEAGILPHLAPSALAGFIYDGFFIDIGVPADYQAALKAVPAHFHRPAVFLDRDGTLNADRGYVHTPSEFEWLAGAIETIRELNDLGYLVLVVTNQAGIARGYYSEADVEALHRWMNCELKPYGAHIDGFYYCPHHPTSGQPPYLTACDCRKPAPGLVLRAAREWDVDLARSLAFGNSPNDEEAFRAAGIPSLPASLADLRSLARRLSSGSRG